MSLGKMSFLKLDIFSKKKAMNLLNHNLSAGLKVNIEDEAYNGLPIFNNELIILKMSKLKTGKIATMKLILRQQLGGKIKQLRNDCGYTQKN